MKFKLGVLKDFDKLIGDTMERRDFYCDNDKTQAALANVRLRALLDAKKVVLKREAT